MQDLPDVSTGRLARVQAPEDATDPTGPLPAGREVRGRAETGDPAGRPEDESPLTAGGPSARVRRSVCVAGGCYSRTGGGAFVFSTPKVCSQLRAPSLPSPPMQRS